MTFKELLDIAKTGLRDLTTLKSPDFRLEQAEFKTSSEEWEIIVSYLVPNINRKHTPLQVLTSEFEFYRIYKKLKIDKNKEIIGFYIYENK